MHLHSSTTKQRRWRFPLDESAPAQKSTISKFSRWRFDFFRVNLLLIRSQAEIIKSSWSILSKNTCPGCGLNHRRRRWGALAPSVGVRCPNFGQFHIFWASLLWKIYSECWIEKPSQGEWRPLFLEVTTIWTEEAAQFEWRPFFLEVTTIWKSGPIWAKTFSFFFWRLLQSGKKKRPNLSEDLFFFLEITAIWTEKKDRFVRQLSSRFSAKTLVPPKWFWAPTPMGWTQDHVIMVVAKTTPLS